MKISLFGLLIVFSQALYGKVQINAMDEKLSTFNTALEINDPHTGKINYRGIFLIEFLDKNIDKWKKSKFIRFTSDDGYKVDVPVERIIKYSPFLATSIVGKKKFEIFDIFQDKTQSLAPAYLVWDHQKHRELKNESTFYWPYRIFVIEKTDESLLNSTEDLSFKKNCSSCHRPEPLGIMPSVNDVKAKVRGMNNTEFNRFLKDPSKVKSNSKMPRIDLNKQNVQDIYLWLMK